MNGREALFYTGMFAVLGGLLCFGEATEIGYHANRLAEYPNRHPEAFNVVIPAEEEIQNFPRKVETIFYVVESPQNSRSFGEFLPVLCTREKGDEVFSSSLVEKREAENGLLVMTGTPLSERNTLNSVASRKLDETRFCNRILDNEILERMRSKETPA